MLSDSATSFLSSPVVQLGLFCFVVIAIAMAVLQVQTGTLAKMALAVIGFIVTAVVVMPILTGEGARSSWEQFKIDHKCVVVEQRDSQTTTGVGFTFEGKAGVGFGSTPAQVAYKCDDGVTYWKDR